MIREFADITNGESIGPVDVCIVGTGAGGGVMANYIAKAGFSVVILEKGGHFSPKEQGRKEVEMLTKLQAMYIFTPAEGEHTRVSLIAGECFGGGTLGCEGNTFDFPEVIKDDWEKLGLKSFSRKNEKLNEWQQELNALSSVTEVLLEHHNPNNQLLIIGAEREGLKWKHAHRPQVGCMRCGNCTQGCRYGAKQDAARTYLKGARQHGAVAYCGAEVDKVALNNSGAGEKFTVTAKVTDRKAPPPRDDAPPSKSLTVRARQVVMAAGPLGNTRILLNSGINPNGVVGTKFTTHPSSFTYARYPENVMIKGWDGMCCSSEVHHYSNIMSHEPYYEPDRHGFILESANSLPWGIANLLPGTGAEHLARMRDYNHLAGCEVIMKSDAYGTITPDRVIFDISENDNKRLLFATWLMARMAFRTGAVEVYTGLPGLILTHPSQLGEIYNYHRGQKPGFMLKQANLYSGHIFGGCVMGTDPKSSFADETGECHEVKGLWVGDGSAFPTNTGVNCLMSIQLVARKIAEDFISKNQKRTGA